MGKKSFGGGEIWRRKVSKQKYETALIYTATVVTLSTLYAAQPIQPIFEKEFSLSRFQAVIFTTAMMLPLGIAPIFYGFFLESFSIKKILRISLFLLGGLEVLFSLSGHYALLLNLRGLQGLLIPAILTSLSSYISQNSSVQNVQKSMSAYIGITIVGGFLGRYFSGLFTEFLGWRFFFFVLGVLLLLLSFFLRRLCEEVKVDFIKPNFNEVLRLIKIPHNFYIFVSMFLIFFIFQGVLNFIPFALSEASHGTRQNITSSKTGLVYAGYIVGLFVSLNVTKVISFFGSQSKAMLAGGMIYFLALFIFQMKSYEVFFLNMFLFCLGMFTVHSIAAGFVNRLAKTHKAITNGLYISFYYAGGALGSFVPGVIYQYSGWHIFIGSLSLVSLLSLFFLFRLQKVTSSVVL